MGCTEQEKPGGNPDGTFHKTTSSRAGRPDLQRRADLLYEKIGPRLDAIDQEFAEKHGFGFRPRIEGDGGGLQANLDQGGLGGGEATAGELSPPKGDGAGSGGQGELFAGRGLDRLSPPPRLTPKASSYALLLFMMASLT